MIANIGVPSEKIFKYHCGEQLISFIQNIPFQKVITKSKSQNAPELNPLMCQKWLDVCENSFNWLHIGIHKQCLQGLHECAQIKNYPNSNKKIFAVTVKKIERFCQQDAIQVYNTHMTFADPSP